MTGPEGEVESASDVGPRPWLLPALAAVASLPFLLYVVPFAWSAALYLGRPLLRKYGVPGTAYYVSASQKSSRHGGYIRLATFRYGDADGETRQFEVAVSLTEQNAFERMRSVPIHYVPGWPSTAAFDETDPFDYASAWFSFAAGLSVLVVWFVRSRRPR
jgi:hypothetical protein